MFSVERNEIRRRVSFTEEPDPSIILTHYVQSTNTYHYTAPESVILSTISRGADPLMFGCQRCKV